jgi:hypothetical protein
MEIGFEEGSNSPSDDMTAVVDESPIEQNEEPAVMKLAGFDALDQRKSCC